MSRVRQPMDSPDPMPNFAELDAQNFVENIGRSLGPVQTVHMDLICPSFTSFPHLV